MNTFEGLALDYLYSAEYELRQCTSGMARLALTKLTETIEILEGVVDENDQNYSS